MSRRRDPPVAAEPEGLKGFDDFETTLGDIMRGERATLGKSLLDVQRDLKIKAAYIAAIENSDPTAFETQGFVAGYVRSYARYLGMDPEQAFTIFCRESGFQTAHGMSAGASARREKRAHSKPKGDPLVSPAAPYLPEVAGRFSEVEPRAIASIAVLAMLVAGLGYGGWSVLQEIQRVRVAPVAQTPGVASSVDPLAEVAPDGQGEPDVELTAALPDAAALDRLYRPQALDMPVLVPRDGPIGAVDPTQVGALARLVPEAPAIDTTADVPLPEAAAAAEEVETPVVVAQGPPTVELFAVRPAWVRVQAADGTVLFEKILDAGERYTVPQSDTPARLRAGNSGSVYFQVAGETYGPAGSSATVAKNIALGAEDVTGVYALADLDSDPVLKRIVELAAAEAASD